MRTVPVSEVEKFGVAVGGVEIRGERGGGVEGHGGGR